MSAGTLKHEVQGTTATSGVNRTDISLSGNFSLTGGAINLDGLGFAAGYTYQYVFNSNPTLVTEGVRQNITTTVTGGSHGGRGGSYSTAGHAAIFFDAYDDYQDPTLPGSGALTAVTGGAGGGAFRLRAPAGTCTLSGGATLKANGALNGGAGGSISMLCGTLTATNTWTPSGVIQANGGAASGTARGGGGGGRIALRTTGNSASWGYVRPYPSNNSYLTTFKNLVNARGGAAATAHAGGAGTIFVKSGDSSQGDLIIENGTNTFQTYTGKTELIGTTANSNVIASLTSPSEVAITAAGTPFNNRNRAFSIALLHFFTLDSNNFNPSSAGITSVLIGDNGNNSFIAAPF
jgi:hypothetical protein